MSKIFNTDLQVLGAITANGIATPTGSPNEFYRTDGTVGVLPAVTQSALTDASVVTWDLDTAPSAYLLATAGVGNSRQIPNTALTNGIDGENYQLVFQQDATGGRTVTFDTNFEVVGDFDLRANKVNVILINFQGGIGRVVVTNWEGIVTGLSNVGTGQTLLTGNNIKSLKAGTNITLTPSADEILIDAAGGSIVKKGKANQVLLADSDGNEYWSNNFNLSNSLKLCYVADTRLDNVNKLSPLQVTEHNATLDYIKVNLNDLAFLEQRGTSDEPWVLSLGGENVTYAEVVRVQQDLGEIYYIEKKGTFNPTVGTKIEFFNPFLNYELLTRTPLLTLTDLASITATSYNFIVANAIVEGDGYYDMIVQAYGTNNAFYIARSTDLQNWTFINEQFSAYSASGMEMASSPYRLDDGNLLVFAAFKKTTPTWSSVIGIFDNDYVEIQTFQYVTFPKPADILAQDEDTLEILDVIHFDGHYRAIVHYRKDDNDPNEVTKEVKVKSEKSDANLMKFLERGFLDAEYKWIDVQDSAMFNIFATKKNDGATYVENNGRLSLLLGAESANNGEGITSNNRVIGMGILKKGLTEDSERWEWDKASPFIINPIQLHISYPDLDWAWDHIGRQMSFVIVNNTMYLFTSFGGDQATIEYAPAGLKLELSQ